jgi:hypothetical protein
MISMGNSGIIESPMDGGQISSDLKKTRDIHEKSMRISEKNSDI